MKKIQGGTIKYTDKKDLMKKVMDIIHDDYIVMITEVAEKRLLSGSLRFSDADYAVGAASIFGLYDANMDRFPKSLLFNPNSGKSALVRDENGEWINLPTRVIIEMTDVFDRRPRIGAEVLFGNHGEEIMTGRFVGVDILDQGLFDTGGEEHEEGDFWAYIPTTWK